jgi:hypothetical protein
MAWCLVKAQGQLYKHQDKVVGSRLLLLLLLLLLVVVVVVVCLLLLLLLLKVKGKCEVVPVLNEIRWHDDD